MRCKLNPTRQQFVPSVTQKTSTGTASPVLATHHVAGDAVNPLFETIDRLSEEVKKLDRVIADMTEDDEVVQLIKTIPGAGLITAATIRAFTDDIRRYPTAAKYAAYAGLVPCVPPRNHPPGRLSPSPDDSKQEHDNGYDQESMDQAPHGVRCHNS